MFLVVVVVVVVVVVWSLGSWRGRCRLLRRWEAGLLRGIGIGIGAARASRRPAVGLGLFDGTVAAGCVVAVAAGGGAAGLT
mgnify:CR=1 FL=1